MWHLAEGNFTAIPPALVRTCQLSAELGQQLRLADFSWWRGVPEQSRSYAVYKSRSRGALGRDLRGHALPRGRGQATSLCRHALVGVLPNLREDGDGGAAAAICFAFRNGSRGHD